LLIYRLLKWFVYSRVACAPSESVRAVRQTSSPEASTREITNTRANRRAPHKKRRVAPPLSKTTTAYTRLARAHTGGEMTLSPTLTWISANGTRAPQATHTMIDLCQPSHDSDSNCHSQEAPVKNLQRSPGYESVPEAGEVDSSRKTTALQSSYRHEAVQCFHYDSMHRVLICKEHVVKQQAVSYPAPMLLSTRVCDTPPFQRGYIYTVLTSSM
jgi:hypothetical protein